MTADKLKSLQKNEPFEPFRLILSNGSSFDIPHPNFLWVWGRNAHIGTHGDTTEGLCDRFEIIELSQINEAEVICS